jgi:tetratricopeptide (TPR) repeat protein
MRLRNLIIVFLLAGGSSVQAQQTELYSGPGVNYRRAENLFEQGKWNGSIAEFNRFLAQGTADRMTRADAEYYIAVAKLYADHSDGEAALLAFLDRNPGSYKTNNANLALGDYYFKNGKYSRALTYYKNADASGIPFEERNRLRFNMGYSQVLTRKYKEAVETLEPLTDGNAEYEIRANYYYGYACYYLGEYNKALQAFRKIEENGPQSLRFFVAQIYYMKGDYQKAVAYLEKLNIASYRNRASFLKGKCHYRLNEFESAAEAFTRSGYGIDSLEKGEVYEVGYTYYKVRQYNDAVRWYLAIANAGDSMAQVASLNLADCFLKLGRKQDAYNAFFEAQRSDFNKKAQENAMLNYAKMAVELGFSKNAITYLQRFTEQFPQSADKKQAQKLLASLFLNSDDYRTAIQVLEAMGELDPQARETYQKVTLLQGQRAMRDRDFDAAIKLFDKSLLYKNDRRTAGEAAYWKGEILLQKGEYAEAIQWYQRFAEAPECNSLPYYSWAFYGMGYCRFKQRRYSEAAAFFQQYKNQSRKGNYNEMVYSDAMLRLGDCYFMTRNMEAALENYSYVSGKKGAASDYALFQKGMIYGFTGQSQQKIATMKRIPNEYPESPYVPDAIFEQANEQITIGQIKDAERNLLYLIQDFKGKLIVRRAYQSLGQLYYKQEKDDKAIDMYKRLVTEFPGTPEAQRAIEKIEKIYRENGRGSEYLSWLNTVPNVSVTASRRDSILYNSAYTLYERKDYEGAVREFEKYLNDFRNGFFVIPANYLKAISHEKRKEKDKAVFHYRVVADAAASEYQEESLLGIVDIWGRDKARCAELIPYLEKLEKLTQNRDNLLFAVHRQMRCALETGNQTLAERKAEQLNGLEFTKPDMLSEALLVLGRINYTKNEKLRALDLFRRNFGKYDNVYAAESKYMEALILFENDSLQSAKKSVFDFNNQFSSYDEWLGKSFNLLGDIYLKMGDVFSARATWNSVIANFSDMPSLVNEAKEKLAALERRGAAPEGGED